MNHDTLKTNLALIVEQGGSCHNTEFNCWLNDTLPSVFFCPLSKIGGGFCGISREKRFHNAIKLLEEIRKLEFLEKLK